MKLLIVEDDKDILDFLIRGFSESNYIIETADNGSDGEYLASMNKYDAIILDWMMPEKTGIDVLKSLRANKIFTPILMLTAKNEIENRVNGLNSGCDDYLPKPFSFDELKARVEALYRRNSHLSNIIEFADITINLETKSVLKNDLPVRLTLKEYELLALLLKNKNSFVSKITIEEMLYTNEEFINSNVIQVTIYNLRKKIGKEYIKSFRGIGYKIEI